MMPANLDGPNDNYDWANCHVLPALIRKAHEAKLRGACEYIVLGSGSARREFLHGIEIAFSGEGDKQVGTVARVSSDKAKCKVGDVIVRVDPRYYRPTEVKTRWAPSKSKLAGMDA